DAGPGGTGTVSIANNGVLNVAGPITVWPTGTLQSYPVSISTSELRLRGGKLSAWSNFNAPISNGGGTIEVPGSNMLFLNNSLTTSRIGIAKLSDLHGDPYLLIRPTRIGDLNLDGTVTISDFIDLSSNFGQSGPNITWQEGDLNYDSAVTISDFIELSANFGS